MTHAAYWLFDETCSLPQIEGYVGVTSNWPLRLKQHRSRPGVGREHRGFDAVILFVGTKKECRGFEYDLRPRASIGWNKYPGGMMGFCGRHSEETKAKLRDARLRQADPRKGRHHTAETKENIRAKKKGTPCTNPGYRHSPEVRAVLRKKRATQVITAEARRKMSISQKAAWARRRARNTKGE
jgi:NUMOD3 motif